MRILDLPDIHFGMQSEVAVAAAIALAKHFKPDHIIQGGDALDLGALSSHPAKSFAEKVASVEAEENMFRAFVKKVRGRRKTPVTWILGNHEHRLERYLLSNAPQLKGMITIEKRLGDCVTDIVPYVKGPGLTEYLEVGDMLVVHGWTHCKAAAAKHLELTRGRSILFHHVHRAQYLVERDIFTGRNVYSVCPGTLSDTQPIYRHSQPTTWTHGCVLLQVDDSGHTTPFMIPISATGEIQLPSGKILHV